VVVTRYNIPGNIPFVGGHTTGGHPVSGCLTVGFSSVLVLMKDRKKKEERFVDPRNTFIGARIQALRIAAGYTSQEKAAYAFNIGRSQWADYEKGAEMKLTTLWKICDAFGITPHEFFSEGFD
jgi:DNA-binding XRE family transcriptional regulator